MKLTDHAKNLSLSHTASDDSRLGEAFLIAIAALEAVVNVYENTEDGKLTELTAQMYEKASDALMEIEGI